MLGIVESWAGLVLLFCLGYILGSYQRNKTKLSYYKLGVVEATDAIQQQLAAQHQQQLQQPTDEDSDKTVMGFQLTKKDKE